MPGISIHAVDIARGIVAGGLKVRVERLTPEGRILVASGAIASDGTLQAPALSAVLPAGVYEASFAIAEYFAREGVTTPEIDFLGDVPFRFGLDDPAAHYHLPFKFTPWGYSCFRGA